MVGLGLILLALVLIIFGRGAKLRGVVGVVAIMVALMAIMVVSGWNSLIFDAKSGQGYKRREIPHLTPLIARLPCVARLAEQVGDQQCHDKQHQANEAASDISRNVGDLRSDISNDLSYQE